LSETKADRLPRISTGRRPGSGGHDAGMVNKAETFVSGLLPTASDQRRSQAVKV
jgi:hypothetical protein